MTGLERDFLNQLTRIADALEKQNSLQEKAMENLNVNIQSDEDLGDISEAFDTAQNSGFDQEKVTSLIQKLSKFK